MDVLEIQFDTKISSVYYERIVSDIRIDQSYLEGFDLGTRVIISGKLVHAFILMF